MPWFRWLTKHVDAVDDTATQQEETAPPAEPAPAPIETPAGEPSADAISSDTPADEAGAPARKRRRGSRGGRGRKKTPTTADGESVDTETVPTAARAGSAAKEKEAPERKDGQRRRSSSGSGGGSSQRRRQPPRRAPLPSAKRELVISVDVGEQRVAVLEDDRVAEVYLERPESRSIVGNIYLGTVDNVLPGMEAAFIEIGLEKNGFLYVDEIVVPELEGKRHGKKIQDLISRGQTILVQAVKDPMKTKGARLTTEISLPGRFLVLVPNGEGLGVSRRLEDAERTRLKEILKEIAPKEGGVIVRTAAEGASAEDVERDLVFLQRLWKTIQARAEKAAAPELVYQEAELPLRLVRDLFAGDFVAAHVDNERTHKRIVGYLKKTSPHMVERVQRWKEKERLFDQFGIEEEIASTLARRVDLPSGGYLIFDYAEAFTVIDVNTGRFVGSRSKSSTQRLEDTIVKNNLEAVKEVVRQLRLRDIGGIIVIDFIDMANPKNRQAVEEAFRTELERDRTKTYVVEISPLGLVEMTRQNVTDGPREVMTRRCTTCGGDGIVVSDATYAMAVERRLRDLAAASAGSRVVQAYRVAVHPRTLALLAGPGGERLAALEETTKRRFFLVEANGHAHGDHFEVLAEGKLDDLRPASSLEEGATVEVKLVEVGLHDAGDGVAKVDGSDVVVAGAAHLVGKKATVVVGRVLDGVAFARIASGTAVEAPITFESEAEKPTRAPARRKAAEPAVTGKPDDSADAAEETIEPEEDGESETTEAGATPRKRTRRGSRGGRRRKKKPTDGTSVEGDAEDETTDDAERGATSVVPRPSETDDDGSSRSSDPADTADAPAPRPRQRQKRTPKIHVPGDGRTPTTTEAPETSAPLAETSAEPDATADATVTDGDPPAAEDGAPAPAKKRTRRGSRGGRRRKKPAGANGPAASEAAGDGDGAVASDDGSDGATAPPEQPAEPAPVKPTRQRTRSASRPKEPSPPSEAPPEPTGDYVPMSEWIDEFERS